MRTDEFRSHEDDAKDRVFSIALAHTMEQNKKHRAAKWLAGNALDLALAAFFLVVALLIGSR